MKSILEYINGPTFILHGEIVRIGDKFGNSGNWWLVTDIKEDRVYHTSKSGYVGSSGIGPLNEVSYRKL